MTFEPEPTDLDALGRVTDVSNPLGAFVYAYVDETSRLSGVTYPFGTGLSTIYSYYGNAAPSGTGNGDQRLQEIKNLKGSTPLSKFDYTYNTVGTIATWTWPWENSDQSPAANKNGRYRYCDSVCMAAYATCLASNGAERVCKAGNDLGSYCASHPGTCITVGGIVIIIIVQPETAPVLAPAL